MTEFVITLPQAQQITRAIGALADHGRHLMKHDNPRGTLRAILSQTALLQDFILPLLPAEEREFTEDVPDGEFLEIDEQPPTLGPFTFLLDMEEDARAEVIRRFNELTPDEALNLARGYIPKTPKRPQPQVSIDMPDVPHVLDWTAKGLTLNQRIYRMLSVGAMTQADISDALLAQKFEYSESEIASALRIMTNSKQVDKAGRTYSLVTAVTV